MPSEMISFGGGVNSGAVVIEEVEDGWRGPIVMANPGGENPSTFCWVRYFEQAYLRPRGMEITWLSPVTHPKLYDDKRLGGLVDTLEGYCLAKGIIPLLSVRWCSVQFKRTPLENWRIQHGIDRTLIGISVDESASRVHDDQAIRYPLLERQMTRAECIRTIQRAGLEVPPKSGCFFCPGQALGEWRRLYYEHPDLYERAAQLERNASARCQKSATLDPHGQSLDQMRERRWQGQTEMDLSEWLPCICTL